MDHVVTRPREPFLTSDGRLEVHQIPVWRDNLVWLLVCTETGETAAVDGPEAGPVLDYCAARGLTLGVILNTHTHGDHVGINRDLGRRGLLADMRVVGSKIAASAVPGITAAVGDDDEVRVGKVVGRALLTEGHIDGHMSYLFDDALFCGDALFTGGCGYLFDGPAAKMHHSLTRLAALPGGTRVCCAHEYTEDNLRFAASVDGDNAALRERIEAVRAIRAEGGSAVPSLMAEEHATNPFLRGASDAIRRAVHAALPGHALDTPEQVFAATRALKDRRSY